MPDLRQHSKKIYTERSSDQRATEGEINVGSLQRIADATEVMATNHLKLMEDRDRYKRWYESEQAANKSLGYTIRALKGAITRLKNSRK